MSRGFHLGQRLSYSNAICTVRYAGPITGTAGEWLGVEWDDPNRGKHDGTYQDVKYFESRSTQIARGRLIPPTFQTS